MRSPTMHGGAVLAAMIATLALALAPAGTVRADGTAARALGMAGAVTPLASGVEAPLWNPANLALPGGPSLSIEFLSASASVANNGIDLDLYNRTNGQVLTEGDKEDLMVAIPYGGLQASADATASALSVQWHQTALSVRGYAAAWGNLPHEFFELVLEGNEENPDVNFDDAAGEAVSYASVAMSGATTVLRAETAALHVGANLHYLQGLGAARLTDAQGFIATEDEGIVAEGQVTLETATRGRGVGLDLGLTLEMQSGWRVALAAQRAFARMTFDGGVESRTYQVTADTLSVDTLIDADDAEDLIHDSEETTRGGSFDMTLPPVLVLGIGRDHGRASYAVQWTQGLRNGASGQTEPRVAVGGEFRFLPWMPVRGGVAYGGVQGTTASLGLGLAAKAFRLDVAAATHGSLLPGHARGVTFALGMGLSL